MKILHVVSDLNPHSGGTTTIVRSLCKYQARASMNIFVCTTNSVSLNKKQRSAKRVLRQDGVTYLYFPCLSPLLFSFAMIRWFKKQIRHFDFIHIHGLYRFPVTAAAWFARRAGIPYMIMPHGSLDLFLYKQSQYNLFLKRIYERLFEIPNLNHATAIHYTAKKEKERTAFLKIRSKPIILPNGIDWDHYRFLPPKGRFRHRIALNDKTPLVLFLGRINFKKGLNILIPSFANVIQQYPSACLAIVGPDSYGYRSKMRQLCSFHRIQDKVLFIDHLGIEKVKEAYVDANVFVLPSYTENFGLTVVEAMACSTPVIISDQVNICLEVQSAGAGIVVNLDPHLLSKSICRILGDKRAANAMGARGRIAAEIRYAWPSIVAKMIQIYQRFIKEKTSTNCQPVI